MQLQPIPYHFSVCKVHDYSQVDLNAPFCGILADAKIGIFAISTYNTDYVLMKQENFQRAMELLASAGYEVLPEDLQSNLYSEGSDS